MNRRIVLRLILLIGGLISGCGGSEFGYLVVRLEDALGPVAPAALSSEAEKLGFSTKTITSTQFLVTVTGDGIETPLTANADSTATEIRIDGVPYKAPLTVLIEAVNTDGTVIRRRNIQNLVIEPGVVAPMEMSLNTVPVALNLKEGSVVLADRLRVLGFGEPGSSIRVEATTPSQSISLNENVGEDPIVVSPSISTGLFEFKPSSRLVGKQKVTLIDEETGESSVVSVYVIDGANRPGRQVVSIGDLSPHVTVGSSMGIETASHFPIILENFGNDSK